MTTIHGYTYGQPLPTSPVSTGDLDLLLSTLLWTDHDAAALARAGAILEPRVEAVLDVDAMHAAWFKAVTLTVALWSQPYGLARW